MRDKSTLQSQPPTLRVAEKTKHCLGLLFGVRLRGDGQQHQLAADTLSGLRERRIVRDALIDQLMGEEIGKHASYFGKLVWVLMTLEMSLGRTSQPTAAVQRATPVAPEIRIARSQ